MAESLPGQFVWYELMTTDPAAAMAFYGDVVGWTTQAFGEGYTMWVGHNGPLGGVMNLPEPAKAMGAPPHWMASVRVESVDQTAALVRELGGKVYLEPTDMPEVGRYAVCADPQGATFALFTPKGSMTRHPPGDREFVWSELATTEPEKALAFYGRLFGWKLAMEMEMGAMGKYRIFSVGDDPNGLGGIFPIGAAMPMPTCWTYYTHVPDLDAAVEKAKAKGGSLLMGPMEIPDGTRIAVMKDPQGAAFALHAGTPKGK